MIKINGEEIIFAKFPNGETRIIEESFFDAVDFGNTVSFKYEDDSDLIKLMLIKNYLDETHLGHPNHLIIYYMPYSRMDRSENDSPFTLKYVANFINGLEFDSVEVIEPHSFMTVALLDRVEANYINFELVETVKDEVNFDPSVDYIVFPDAGAEKRYSKMLAKNVLVGQKSRNFQTGVIDSLKLVGEVTGGKKAIIVDDLSSFGGTFINTATELRKLGVEEVYLLVAHAENNIFKRNDRTGKLLFEHITKVFTTDSILTEQNAWHNKIFLPQLHIFKLEGENA